MPDVFHPETKPLDPQAPSAPVRWTIAILALAAAAVAGYLLYVSATSQTPAGCGAGSGCSQVLTSRWSSLFGIPVSLPALATYLTMFAATWLIRPSVSPLTAKVGWTILTLLASVVLTSAIWFVGLQFFALKAVCPWCMTDHALGTILAVVVFCSIPWAGKEEDDPAQPKGARLDFRGAALLFLTGLLCTATIAGAQAMFAPASRVVRLPPDENADTGPGAERAISVLGGDLQLRPHDELMMGSADATNLLVTLFDYCCPHCRRTHGYLAEAVKQHPDKLGVALLPCPLNSQCNPHWEDDQERFEDSCELARLAYAVWRARPEAFDEFDRWLFEPETPRELAEAQAKAQELVGDKPLDPSAPWISDRIARNADAFAHSGAGSVPVLMAPTTTFRPVVGRYETKEVLMKVLQSELIGSEE